jgi:hypothetical protein
MWGRKRTETETTNTIRRGRIYEILIIIAPVGKYRNCLSVLPFGKLPFGADAPLSPGGGK